MSVSFEKTLRPMIDPQLVTLVYHENEPVGIGFALPDWNLVLRHLRRALNAFR